MFALCRPHGSTPKGTPWILDPNLPTPVDCRHSVTNCGRLGQIWSQRRAYRKPPSLFRMVRSMAPMTSPSAKMGALNSHLAMCRIFQWPYLGYLRNKVYPIHLMFRCTVFRSADRMTLFPVRSSPRWRPWHVMTRHDKTRKILSTADQCYLLPNYFSPCKISLAWQSKCQSLQSVNWPFSLSQ